MKRALERGRDVSTDPGDERQLELSSEDRVAQAGQKLERHLCLRACATDRKGETRRAALLRGGKPSQRPLDGVAMQLPEEAAGIQPHQARCHVMPEDRKLGSPEQLARQWKPGHRDPASGHAIGGQPADHPRARGKVVDPALLAVHRCPHTIDVGVGDDAVAVASPSVGDDCGSIEGGDQRHARISQVLDEASAEASLYQEVQGIRAEVRLREVSGIEGWNAGHQVHETERIAEEAP